MGKRVVLIVEGEVLIRLSAVHMVQDVGYTALDARNADEAIEILEGRDDIEAMFSHIRMSGSMDGLKLADLVHDRWPSIHLILTSGMDVPDGAKWPANGRFIRKPYTPGHVAAALKELFGSDPGRDRFTVAVA